MKDNKDPQKRGLNETRILISLHEVKCTRRKYVANI